MFVVMLGCGSVCAHPDVVPNYVTRQTAVETMTVVDVVRRIDSGTQRQRRDGWEAAALPAELLPLTCSISRIGLHARCRGRDHDGGGSEHRPPHAVAGYRSVARRDSNAVIRGSSCSVSAMSSHKAQVVAELYADRRLPPRKQIVEIAH